MFCSKCGSSTAPSDTFCSKCGSLLSVQKADSSADSRTTAPPASFGKVNTKWWAQPPLQFSLPDPYDWLNGPTNLLVFDNHLSIVPGKDKAVRGSDALAALALLGGALLVARSIKDKIRNKLDTYDSVRVLNAYEAGRLIWCKKSDAEVWEVRHSRGVEPAVLRALYCAYVSLAGPLPFLYPLENPQSMWLNPIRALGCRSVVKATDVPKTDGYMEYLRLFGEARNDKAVSYTRY